MSEEPITKQMKRLLYMIAEFTKSEGKYGKLAIKELPIKALIFKGIIDEVFDYDYAPQSIMYMDNRRFLNISREGEDDLDDLRDEKLLNKIRLATQRHVFIYAFNLTQEGIEYLQKIPKVDKEAVNKLIYCKCKNLYNISVQKEGIFLICEKCNVEINTEITEIEDVAYKCAPLKIKTRLTRK
ncbi:MAG: hypothetical protein ACTSO9_01910 [Candidatus Helarchaeota archaeon]